MRLGRNSVIVMGLGHVANSGKPERKLYYNIQRIAKFNFLLRKREEEGNETPLASLETRTMPVRSQKRNSRDIVDVSRLRFTPHRDRRSVGDGINPDLE
jgi:hypothetical protein